MRGHTLRRWRGEQIRNVSDHEPRRDVKGSTRQNGALKRARDRKQDVLLKLTFAGVQLRGTQPTDRVGALELSGRCILKKNKA